ncbi:MAG: DUF1049 domain-containing protein [Rhodobacteraceae bacterium]|nr:DUF1049 domain-containing protein [Paracoccaceae bacterium]
MIRLFKIAFLALVALSLLILAYANRGPVTLYLLPEGLMPYLPAPEGVTVPLFAVILLSGLGGVTLGFIWEWLREHKHRAEAARRRDEARRLKREMESLRKDDPRQKDDVLALLE